MFPKSFFIFLTGFASGIAFRSFFDLGFSFTIFILFLGAISFVLFYLGVELLSRKVLTISIFIFAIGLGILRFDISDMNKGSVVLDSLINQTIKIEAIITDEPDEREFNTRLVVEFQGLFIDDVKQNIKTKAIITTEHYPKWNYGDYVLLVGRLQKPKNFFTNGNNTKEFQYVSYLEKDGIYYQMFHPEVLFLEGKQGNVIKEKLFTFKRAFLENLFNVIPEPHVSFLGGLVLGAKQSLGKKLLDDFRVAGIIHIVVLSGYNISIVAEALMRALSFLPRFAKLSFGAGSIVMFAIMVGGGATVVRASIMALFVLLARATGRTSEITFALFLAGFGMILWNPKILIFDPSFQLSFLATIGLIYLAPIIENYFKFIPTKWQFREFATATISTQIFVLPLLLYKMGEMSIVSLPVNILILIFIPITMLFGFLTGIIGFISTALSFPFAFVTYWLLSYQLEIIELFSSLPFASVRINFFPLWFMVVIYLLYIVILFKIKSKKESDYE